MANTKSWTVHSRLRTSAVALRPDPCPFLRSLQGQLKAGEFNKVHGRSPTGPQPASAAQRPPPRCAALVLLVSGFQLGATAGSRVPGWRPSFPKA